MHEGVQKSTVFRMLVLEFLLLAVVGLALWLTFELAKNAISSHISLEKFKKQQPNLTFLPKEDLSWFGNHLFKMTMHNNCQRLHERHLKYGDTLGGMIDQTPLVSTTDLDLIKQVCIDSAIKSTDRLKFQCPMREFEYDCILFAGGEQWRRIRKSFAPALKPQRFKMPNVVLDIERTIDRLIKAIEKQLEASSDKGRAEFNIDNLMHRFSLSVVLSCFYKQYDLVNFDLEKRSEWVDMVERGLEEIQNNPAFILGLIVPAIRRLIDMVVFYLHPIGKWRRELMEFVRQQARIGLQARKQLEELRRASKPDELERLDPNNFILKDGTKFSRNMVDYIVDEFHAGKITSTEYVNSSVFLLAAADKTISDALVFTLYQLAVEQGIQKKLRESIRAEGTDSEYLTWVINESLRMNPPVPGGCSRTLTHELHLKDGSVLQPGTFLFTPLYTIHRMPKYWGDDAEEFKPERWAKAADFHPAQFMPFGAGLRACLGKDFALYEMKMLLCVLLDRYHIACRGPKKDVHQFDSPLMIFMLHKTHFYLTLSRL